MARRSAMRHAAGRTERPVALGQTISTVADHAPAGSSEHAMLVAALPPAEPGDDALEISPTLSELIATEIRGAVRGGRFDIAASLEVFAVRWGALLNTLPDAMAVASPELAEALARLTDPVDREEADGPHDT